MEYTDILPTSLRRVCISSRGTFQAPALCIRPLPSPYEGSSSPHVLQEEASCGVHPHAPSLQLRGVNSRVAVLFLDDLLGIFWDLKHTDDETRIHASVSIFLT